MKQRIVFILFFLFQLYVKSQTCILIMSLNDTIIIGADSKVGKESVPINFNPKIPQENSYSTYDDCKLFHEKGVFYAAASHSVATILLRQGKESIIRQSVIKDSVQFLKSEATLELENQLNIERIIDKKGFMEDFRNRNVGTLAFVWVYKNIPRCYELKFKIISDSTEKVRIGIVDSAFNLHEKNIRRMIPLGTFQAIYKE